MRKAFLAAITMIAIIAVATPAQAIVGAQPDDVHNQSGFIFNGDKPLCSAVLIAPRVVATAGHCTETLENGGNNARITFDSKPTTALKFYTGVALTHPDFVAPVDDKVDYDTYRNDYGAIILDSPVTDITPLSLPSLYLTDRVDFTVRSPIESGYGFSGYTEDGTPIGGPDQRQSAALPSAGHDQNSDAYLRLGDETTTACTGDSGGPVQLGHRLIAITTGGEDLQCHQWAYYARTDIPAAQDFYKPLIAFADVSPHEPNDQTHPSRHHGGAKQ